jgi:non-heme chloroperoxidase
MKRRSAALAAVAGLGGVALAGAAATAKVRAYLRQEYSRPDPAASDDFSALADTVDHMVASHDGGQLHVIERGPSDAPPLLLVHGVTLSVQVWRYQLRDLAGPFRVLALDQRGHGQSTVGPDGFGLHLLGRDIATVLEALDLRGAVLVGHSMGGFAVQQFCIDHPRMVASRVAGIVLLHTACARLLPVPRRLLPVARRAAVALTARTPAPGSAQADAAFLGTRFTLGLGALPSHVRHTYELSSATDVATTIGSVTACLDMDLRAGLRGLDVPALIIGGTHDRLLPAGHARLIAANLPGSRLVMLDGCGHMGMLERHTELARLITDFASEVRAKAA